MEDFVAIVENYLSHKMKENLQILHQSYIQLCVIYFHV